MKNEQNCSESHSICSAGSSVVTLCRLCTKVLRGIKELDSENSQEHENCSSCGSCHDFDVEAYLDEEYRAWHKILLRSATAELISHVSFRDSQLKSDGEMTFLSYEIPSIKDMIEKIETTEFPSINAGEDIEPKGYKEFQSPGCDIMGTDPFHDDDLDSVSGSSGSETARAWEFEWNNDPHVLHARFSRMTDDDLSCSTASSMPALLPPHVNDDSSCYSDESDDGSMPVLIPRRDTCSVSSHSSGDSSSEGGANCTGAHFSALKSHGIPHELNISIPAPEFCTGNACNQDRKTIEVKSNMYSVKEEHRKSKNSVLNMVHNHADSAEMIFESSSPFKYVLKSTARWKTRYPCKGSVENHFDPGTEQPQAKQVDHDD
jgi:hypothetical protein